MSEEYIEEGINGQWTNWKFEAENYKKLFEQANKERNQLQNNWNELKKYVREELKEAEDDFAQEDFIKVLDRMQELEGKNE